MSDREYDWGFTDGKRRMGHGHAVLTTSEAEEIEPKADRVHAVWVNRIVTDNPYEGPLGTNPPPYNNEHDGLGNILGCLMHFPGDPDDVMSFFPDNTPAFGSNWDKPGDGYACNPLLAWLRETYPQPHERAAQMIIDALNGDDNSGNDE